MKSILGIYYPSMVAPPGYEPLSACWKVPFRQVYATTFGQWLKSCWHCFYVTQLHKFGLRKCSGVPAGANLPCVRCYP